jgi:hypothetical protein
MLSTVVGTLADLVVGVIAGAVVLCAVKLIGKLRRKPTASAANTAGDGVASIPTATSTPPKGRTR